jgi:hypothetical protein
LPAAARGYIPPRRGPWSVSVVEAKGDAHGRAANGPDLRLALHRHVRHEHPGPVALHQRRRRQLGRHALRTSSANLKLGALLEFGLIVTQIGTAVVIYPLVRRQSETVSLGYVAARVMESVFAAIGIISIISVVNVADALSGANGVTAAALGAQGNSLVHSYDWAFLWGPGLVAGIGNGIMLGYLMYRSALVPPRMALLGLAGGSLLIFSFVMQLIGVYKNGEGPSGLFTLPEAVWELYLGVYCAWKGFRTESPLARPDPAITYA